MPSVIFATQSAQRGDDKGQTSERLMNLYPQPAAEASKAKLVLRSTLGLTEFSNLGLTVTRAIHAANGKLWVVGSGNLYEIDASGVATSRGAVNDSEDTFISANGTGITVTAGGSYYLWDGSSLTQPGGGRISNVGSLDFHAGYTILTDEATGEFEWTDLYAPESRNGLQFATAESRNDKLRRVVVNGREVWLFGEESTEVWYNSGLANENAFKLLPGAAEAKGILASTLAVQTASRVGFVRHDGVVCETQGLRIIPISTPPVEAAIADSTPTHVFGYSDEGHEFLCVRFADRPAWCFDFKTRLWHERSTGAKWDAWEVIGTAEFNGRWYAVNTLGKIYVMQRVNVDGDAPLSRMAQSRPAYFEGRYFVVRRLEMLGEVGVGAAAVDSLPSELINLGVNDGDPILIEGGPFDGQPILVGDPTSSPPVEPARIGLQVSRDGGHTWEPQIFRSMGRIGKYDTRIVWNALGGGYQFAVRATIADPVDVNIYAAANFEPA